MFSRFGKSKKGSEETLRALNNESYMYKELACTKNSTNSEKDIKAKKISRRTRGRNVLQLVHSDGDEELQSIASDNPYFYTRSRSSNTLDNTSTKKHLLQSNGKRFVKVESKMKTIEASLANQEQNAYRPLRNETINKSDMVYNLKKDMMMKEKFISQIKSQLSIFQQSRKIERSNQQLEMLETQMDAKILQIQEKHAKVSRLKLDGNIDTKIDMAELEYKIEKDQLDILNISQKIQVIKMNLEKEKYTKELTKRECLYDNVKGADITIAIALEIASDTISCLNIRQEGFGLVVSQECNPNVKLGDRVLELDGINVFKITRDDWDNLISELSFPCKTVVMRVKIINKEFTNTENVDTNNLKEDIALIQSRLEQKLSDGRNISTELELAQREKKALSQENIRLSHRIAYLEEHTQDLQLGLQQVKDSLSRTLNTDLHFALSKLDNNELEELKKEKDFMKIERSGSTTSGVYSSSGSVGSDSPVSNCRSNQDTASANISKINTNQTTGNSAHVSTLTIGTDPKKLEICRKLQ